MMLPMRPPRTEKRRGADRYIFDKVVYLYVFMEMYFRAYLTDNRYNP